jgi:hypothetical protein
VDVDLYLGKVYAQQLEADDMVGMTVGQNRRDRIKLVLLQESY